MIKISRLEPYIATVHSHTHVLRNLYQELWICI
nr:MAG TPA: Protein of unknown function (DUF2639) [Caudoviricetes sp.]